MNGNNIKTENLRMAEIRTFDEEKKSSMIPNRRAYTILGCYDGNYKNLFNPSLDYPVYDRLPYSNTTLDGEDYGTMIALVSGKIQDGPCYILDGSMKQVLNKDTVSFEELEEYVLTSGKFFPDRIRMIEDMDFISRMKYRKRYLLDKKYNEEFKELMCLEKKEKQYIK